MRGCRLCEGKLIYDTKETIDFEDNPIEVDGMYCDSCGSFFYELDGQDIIEMAPIERITNKGAASYISDYQRKLMEKNEQLI